MFRSTNFDKMLDKATNHVLMEPDWPTILQICDSIRQNDVQPKYALNSLKKKFFSPNQHTALYALLILESLVKNCGSTLHEEVTTRSYCETLHDLAKTTTNDNVRQKLLELIQAWSVAFRKNPKHNALQDLISTMKNEGYKFPTCRESDAMFSADTAPEWADGDVCHRCRVMFSFVQRKHHCRACGQVFCGQCTQKNTTLPKYGIEKEVRVCDACYDQANKPTAASKAAAEKQETDLPIEYVNSSLAKQSQAPPPRKSEDELREEEELNLALALSQSEAEAKEKEKYKFSSSNSHNNVKVSVSDSKLHSNPSPPIIDEKTNNELSKYLNRSYWESINQNDQNSTSSPGHEIKQLQTSPSAPATALYQSDTKYNSTNNINVNNTNNSNSNKENGLIDHDLEDFINTLRSQVEIFINRMKSNSSRGRSIANDTSVQTLFMNITAMHSKLLRYIQHHDDSRLYYERLQDKLTQVKDARAALDDLREEHREKLRREAEEAERQRQLQMAHKLDIMRKKKQEYLQYQRQLALQRIQEQEREMQIRQEQQKQQYLMGPQYVSYIGSPVHHGQQFVQPPQPPNSAPVAPSGIYSGFQYGLGMIGGQPTPQQLGSQLSTGSPAAAPVGTGGSGGGPQTLPGPSPMMGLPPNSAPPPGQLGQAMYMHLQQPSTNQPSGQQQLGPTFAPQMMGPQMINIRPDQQIPIQQTIGLPQVNNLQQIQERKEEKEGTQTAELISFD